MYNQSLSIFFHNMALMVFVVVIRQERQSLHEYFVDFVTEHFLNVSYHNIWQKYFQTFNCMFLYIDLQQGINVPTVSINEDSWI